jgi:hypothetical protein
MRFTTNGQFSPIGPFSSRLQWMVAVGVLAVALAACGTTNGGTDVEGSGDDTGPDVPDTKKDSGPDIADSSSDDAGLDIVAHFDSETDAAQDAQVEEVAQIDPNLCTSKDKDYATGACGWPCTSSNSCLNSAPCVPTPDNTVCSKPCAVDNLCPAGWQCRSIANTGSSDSDSACVPNSPNLGKPCQEDNDCRTRFHRLRSRSAWCSSGRVWPCRPRTAAQACPSPS